MVEIIRDYVYQECPKCDDLETTYFQPDDEFIAKSLKSGMVKSYMEKTWWGKPVYLVSGLKIARGVSAESEEKRGYGGATEVGIDATAVTGGVPVSGGPKIERKVERREGVTWGGSEDFLFAYRLVRIKLKGEEGGFKEGDYNKGALYNDDDDVETKKEDRGTEGLRELWNIEDVNSAEGAEDVVVVSVADDDVE
jgi:hypothetical protein